ncbi:hypothetical protein BDN70DRAFT_874943 [Pholiota conissans]|uniref:RING-type domain-containing protein n=1 Tax=Pholiota conissans TaxID=109636 RepID=A0A9P6CX49_9AGAR|nr:hypothetical protein BDN70DRAFT_874943 [Pholiota conissans]
MPAKSAGNVQKTRRSSRLIDRQVAATRALSAAQKSSTSSPQAKRRKVSDRPVFSNDDPAPDTSSAMPLGVTTASGSDRRRLQRITSTELDRREKRLLHKEQDFNKRLEELELRMVTLSKMEDETSMMMSQLAEREIESALKQLEEHFTCPLCYEILAAPYSLNPSHCGHTFCGLCILKWFFSRLHRACGGWHESVDCPICRSLLVITPESTPRLPFTFPFVPNRVTASVVESMVEKLVKPPLCSQAKIKREGSESTWASQSRKDRGQECVRKRELSGGTDPEGDGSETSDISAWREGGHMRAEWLKKNREGKSEMDHILSNWSTMVSRDFIEMKQKLGV